MIFKPTQEELAEILDKHKKWLNDEDGGEFANLRGANLCSANLRGANLCSANLRGADLRDANLRGANLRGADLYSANLCSADLCSANLRGANLCSANLRGADLRDANLRGADLRDANLRGADLRDANLRGADLYSAKNADLVKAMTEIVPREGSFIGWKKARFSGKSVLVKLRITEDAKRSNVTGRKCRCSKAEVLSIEQPVDGGDAILCDEAVSDHDPSFVYRVGETVEVSDFCDNRFEECAAGIHFFLTPEEAWNY